MKKSKVKKDGDYDTADEVSSAILGIPGVEGIAYAPYNGYGGDDVDIMVSLDEGTDIQTVIDAINYDDVVDLEDNGDGTYTFTVITGYKLGKSEESKTEKGMQRFKNIFQNEEKFAEHIYELAEQYCPHATRFYPAMSSDIIWDLPSGNHPGMFITEIKEGDERTYYYASITASHYLDYPEHTSDGEMPDEMEEMATEMYDRTNAGGISEADLIMYMGRMDAICADLASGKYMKKSKTKKSKTKKDDRFSTYMVFYNEGIMQKMTDYIDSVDDDSAYEVLDTYSRLTPYDDTHCIVNGKSVLFVNLNSDEVEQYANENGYKLSKTSKGEEKIPVSEDDTVEIEEMDGKRYVEIEPKDEHAEEVATGYEKESDDLNTEDNITHPDTSKPKKSKAKKAFDISEGAVFEDGNGNTYSVYQIKDDWVWYEMNTPHGKDREYDSKQGFLAMLNANGFKQVQKSKTEKSAPPMMSVNDAIRTCAEYQWANKRNGLMPDEIYELTGNHPENFMSGMVARGRVAKMKCADGIMYRFKM